MKKVGQSIRLAATDLSNHLHCKHLTQLDLQAATGKRKVPPMRAPHAVVIQERGLAHEQAYIDSLAGAGLDVVNLRDELSEPRAVQATLDAMRRGGDVIVQGALLNGHWFGRPDVLKKRSGVSDFGGWLYEPYDCKLARETKAASILQLSHYAALLEEAQGALPEQMYIVPPAQDFTAEAYRVLDYAAYYRATRDRCEAELATLPPRYPEPAEHCAVCRWWSECDQHRRTDDHLCLTAGITRLQRKQLHEWNVTTVEALSRMTVPLTQSPRHGSKDGYVRVREQARVQVLGRQAQKPVHEVLPVETGRGLCRLPEPSAGDIFFDIEGDPFVGLQGREYLFGLTPASSHGASAYEALWAFTAEEEKAAFERFVDGVMARWADDPGLHLYHFGHKEPSTLKSLMGRYATRESEIDQWLRAHLFVDLHSIVKQSIRASVEQYSLKDLEPFHTFQRTLPLEQAATALRQVEHALELGRTDDIPQNLRDAVEAYNADDCRSTAALRDWLEGLRAEQCASGIAIPRPVAEDGAAPEAVSERQARVEAAVTALQQGVPAEEAKRSPDQAARWLLSNLLDWHRREEKVAFWEKFRLQDMDDEELREERAAIGGLQLERELPPEPRKRSPLHEYRFPPQETKISARNSVYSRGVLIGTVEQIDPVEGILSIRKSGKATALHPASIYACEIIRSDELKDSLLRIGEAAVDHGLNDAPSFRLASDLLFRRSPRLRAEAKLIERGETVVDAATRLVADLAGGILPVQGPPGAGKTFTAARMIIEAVRQGKRVGVTASSHKVIRNLLEAVQEAAEALKHPPVTCVHKVTTASDDALPAWLSEEKDNPRALAAIRGGSCSVLAGTAWLWAREDAMQSVDLLFVDEAGQMSLATALALTPAATNLVLLGDPRQLEQPSQGSHPEGADVSALDHLLNGAKTIPPDKGLFLAQTWRLHPSICRFTSEVFYEGRLTSREGLDAQRLEGHPWLGGEGLRYLPVAHEGNQNTSLEEVEAIEELVSSLLRPEVHWVDDKGARCKLRDQDILIVAPYNAQVAALHRKLPDMRIGTVDKFQGQQAPVVIYSLTTSSPLDAPRGMEFLYSLSRLNVATSRAKVLAILVASPDLLEPECRTPRQLQLANALCRYIELSEASTTKRMKA